MRNWIFFFVIAWGCVACTSTVAPMNKQTTQASHQALQQAQHNSHSKTTPKALPIEVMSDLAAKPKANQTFIEGNTFDVAVKSLPVDQFFLNLMQNSKENIIVAPGVTGDISLTLHNVTVPEVLRAIKTLYGFNYRKTSFGYQIEPRQIETQVFYLSHPNLLQTSDSSMTVTGAGLTSTGVEGGVGGTGNGGAALSTHLGGETFWPEIDSTLHNLIQHDVGSYANTNQNTGVVVVAAYPDTLEKVSKYLQAIQDINNRQVIIDAKIIELSLYKQFQTGIDWQQAGLSVSSSTGIFNLTTPVSMNDISSVVSLLSQQGNVSVLSNPRISVLNNRPALIKVGNDSYYVTNVTSGTTPVGTTATVTSDVSLTPFFSGIALNVIPSIMPNGTIKLNIHPMVSMVTDDEKTIKISDTQTMILPLASSDIREADSNVEMQSGQIIVLGGLMQRINKLNAKSFAGSSWSASHPTHNDQGAVTELVILLKATLTNKEAWAKEIKTASDAYNHVDQEP